ncbi:hypothetical protein [Tautonia plasticadhaerens]|uniref:Uncharacterized protein n=1 Tax=Tautonia plasticadhaerens TaxID=2527974 RepID=A0A518GXP8_9BACT|nr:hypothetical protein [Tautonia plasticadhaerens]QDV33361.1 hypothetical protein ElP_12320 [Tautonia plasticadhaerens]
MFDVEAALRGYLQAPGSVKEPWMYELLAVAFEYNLAEPQFVRQALGVSAILASRPGDQGFPENLLTVVDLMAARDIFVIEVDLGGGKTQVVRVAELLDLAAERLPHRPEPHVKSLDLAERTLDPERMARAVEGLFSLGWPGVDEAWRSEARLRALALADRLREAGRAPEAEALVDRVEAAEPRDLYARLTWDGYGDLDLAVDEPLGATAEFRTPRTVFGGALVKNGRGSEAEEIYVCPRGFDGEYTFRVLPVVSDPERPITSATLEVITHEGGDREQVRTIAIDPASPEPVAVTLEGGRRTEAMPFVMPKVMVVVDPEDPALPGGEPAPGPAAPAPDPR